MNRPFDIHAFEQGYLRNALFAVEVLDGVTLAPVSYGLKVEAEGLDARQIINSSGMFVWLGTDMGPLKKIVVDPRVLPYERFELPAAELDRPLHTIKLLPRVDYPFAAGMTGLRGTLLEQRAAPRAPVANAEVHLQWLDEDGVTWRDSPISAQTNDDGDFATILRLGSAEVPRVNADGEVTVRLHALRALSERRSAELSLLQGRIADAATLAQRRNEDPSDFVKRREALTFAWDELQP